MRFQQVLINLVKNALKFSPKGIIRVILGYDPDNECIKAAIIDTGRGILSKEIRKLF